MEEEMDVRVYGRECVIIFLSHLIWYHKTAVRGRVRGFNEVINIKDFEDVHSVGSNAFIKME